MILLVLFALLAGAGTALSPCVLPVLPAVLSAGVTGGRRRPLGVALGLALSFTFATVALVYVIAALGLPNDLTRTLAIVTLLVFGVLLCVQPLADRLEAWISRVVPKPKRAAGDGFGSGMLLGASLGFVYAPCAGPILAGVITVSAAQDFTFGRLAVALAYSFGSGAVLYLLMLGGRRITDRLGAFRGRVQVVMGAVMIAVAVVMIANLDIQFENSIARHLPSAFVDPTSRIEQSSNVSENLARLRGGGPASQEGGTSQAAAGERLPVAFNAPDFTGTQEWFNTPGDQPLSLADLRGQVVLVDFWTYTCINCIRTLPYIEAWYRKYHHDGFTVVGVHTPEFPFEREASNVERAIGDFGITYPVVQDNDAATWNAYHNQYWPADYLIDAKGRVRLVHFGEGSYAETEKGIRSLLAEAGNGRLGGRAHANVEKPDAHATPESYLGAARAERFANGPILPGTQTFDDIPASSLVPDQLAYGGDWKIAQDSATAGQKASLELNFSARQAFLVLGSPGRPRTMQVLLDGKPIPDSLAGADVRGGVATISDHRLYRLVALPHPGRHVLTLRPQPGDRGLRVHVRVVRRQPHDVGGGWKEPQRAAFKAGARAASRAYRIHTLRTSREGTVGQGPPAMPSTDAIRPGPGCPPVPQSDRKGAFVPSLLRRFRLAVLLAPLACGLLFAPLASGDDTFTLINNSSTATLQNRWGPPLNQNMPPCTSGAFLNGNPYKFGPGAQGSITLSRSPFSSCHSSMQEIEGSYANYGDGGGWTWAPDDPTTGPATLTSCSVSSSATATLQASVNQSTLTCTITDLAPTCSNGNATTPFNTQVTVALDCVAAITDYNIVSGPNHGSLGPISSSGQVTYTPNPGYEGSDSFSFNATGPGGTSNTATISVSVNANPPSCSNGNATTPFNTQVTVSLGCSGQITEYNVVSGPNHGSLGPISSSGQVTYTPNPGYDGSDSFTFNATGPGGTSNTATISVSVNANPPSCSNGNATTPQNVPVTIALGCSGEITAYHVVSGPNSGTLGPISSNGQVTYTPNNGFSGSDSFTFNATGPGGTSNTATISVSVNANPPSCSNGNATTPQNVPVTIALGCSGEITGYNVVSGPNHGSLGPISSSGQVTYTPNPGYEGSDSFSFNATGPGGTSNTATISVSVNANPPSCSNGNATTPFNTQVTVSLGCSGQITEYNVVSGPNHGSLGPISSSGQVTYTPNPGYDGSDSFTFNATGPGGTSNTATISVSVNANPPSCSNGNATTPQNVPVTIALGCSGEITAYHVVSGPNSGTLGPISSNGQVTYTPNNGFSGSDSFTFNATGPGGTSNTATMTITDTPADLPPVCANNSVVVTGGQPKSIALGCSGEITSLQIVSQPSKGTLSAISAAGQVTYTPNPGYDGSDSFTFNATGPGGTSNTATMTITDTPADLPPVCANNSVVVTGGQPKSITLGCSGEITSLQIVSHPKHGTLSAISAGGRVTYTPNPGYDGSDSFTFNATGPGGTSNTATMTITDTPADLPPVCANHSVVVSGDHPKSITLGCSGEITRRAIVTQPKHGTLSAISAAGQVTYTPNPGYDGSDSFTFNATGPGGTSNTATMTITDTPADLPPVCANNSVVVTGGHPKSITLGCSGEITRRAIVTQPKHGTLSAISAAGQVTYTPNPGYDGSDSFTFNATGPGGTSNTATIAITDTPADLPPVCPDHSDVISFDTATKIRLGCSGEITRRVIVTRPEHGRLIVHPSSTSGERVGAAAVIYQPNSGFTGRDSFKYAAVGPGGFSKVAKIKLTVTTPTVAKLHLDPDRFAPTSHRTPLGPPLPKSAASSAPRGSKIMLKLDSAALVHFFIRRRGAPPPSSPRRRHGFNRNLKAGKNSFRFTGKLYGKQLRAGRYRLYARVVSPSGRRFKRVSTPFTIVAR